MNLHLTNIYVHAAIGALGILIGLKQTLAPAGDAAHRRRGLCFLACSAAVCVTGAFGVFVFDFRLPFAGLTVLIAYQSWSGWRSVQLRGAPLAWPDWLGWLLGAAMGSLLALRFTGLEPNARLAWISLGNLAMLLTWDATRLVWPARWRERLWPYDHAYKVVATCFGMVSAAAGNLLRDWQPWSQLLPSALGLAAIAYVWRRQALSSPIRI